MHYQHTKMSGPTSVLRNLTDIRTQSSEVCEDNSKMKKLEIMGAVGKPRYFYSLGVSFLFYPSTEN